MMGLYRRWVSQTSVNGLKRGNWTQVYPLWLESKLSSLIFIVLEMPVDLPSFRCVYACTLHRTADFFGRHRAKVDDDTVPGALVSINTLAQPSVCTAHLDTQFHRP